MHSLQKISIVLLGIITITCALSDTNGASNPEQSVKIDGIDAEKSLSLILSRLSTEQVTSIVSEMLGGISAAIEPLLGPLAPISDILGSVITKSVTELVTSLLNQTISSIEEQQSTDQVKGYKTFMVTIPTHGKFILVSKTSERQEKFSPGIADGRIADVRGTLAEFIMERAEQANELNNDKPKFVTESSNC